MPVLLEGGVFWYNPVVYFFIGHAFLISYLVNITITSKRILKEHKEKLHIHNTHKAPNAQQHTETINNPIVTQEEQHAQASTMSAENPVPIMEASTNSNREDANVTGTVNLQNQNYTVEGVPQLATSSANAENEEQARIAAYFPPQDDLYDIRPQEQIRGRLFNVILERHRQDRIITLRNRRQRESAVQLPSNANTGVFGNAIRPYGCTPYTDLHRYTFPPAEDDNARQESIQAIDTIIEQEEATYPFKFENEVIQESIEIIAYWIYLEQVPPLTCLKSPLAGHQDEFEMSKNILNELFSTHRSTRLQAMLIFMNDSNTDPNDADTLSTSIVTLISLVLGIPLEQQRESPFRHTFSLLQNALKCSTGKFLCDFVLSYSNDPFTASKFLADTLPFEYALNKQNTLSAYPDLDRVLSAPFMTSIVTPQKTFLTKAGRNFQNLTVGNTVDTVQNDLFESYANDNISEMNRILAEFLNPNVHHNQGMLSVALLTERDRPFPRTVRVRPPPSSSNSDQSPSNQPPAYELQTPIRNVRGHTRGVDAYEFAGALKSVMPTLTEPDQPPDYYDTLLGVEYSRRRPQFNDSLFSINNNNAGPSRQQQVNQGESSRSQAIPTAPGLSRRQREKMPANAIVESSETEDSSMANFSLNQTTTSEFLSFPQLDPLPFLPSNRNPQEATSNFESSSGEKIDQQPSLDYLKRRRPAITEDFPNQAGIVQQSVSDSFKRWVSPVPDGSSSVTVPQGQQQQQPQCVNVESSSIITSQQQQIDATLRYVAEAPSTATVFDDQRQQRQTHTIGESLGTVNSPQNQEQSQAPHVENQQQSRTPVIGLLSTVGALQVQHPEASTQITLRRRPQFSFTPSPQGLPFQPFKGSRVLASPPSSQPAQHFRISRPVRSDNMDETLATQIQTDYFKPPEIPKPNPDDIANAMNEELSTSVLEPVPFNCYIQIEYLVDPDSEGSIEVIVPSPPPARLVNDNPVDESLNRQLQDDFFRRPDTSVPDVEELSAAMNESLLQQSFSQIIPGESNNTSAAPKDSSLRQSTTQQASTLNDPIDESLSRQLQDDFFRAYFENDTAATTATPNLQTEKASDGQSVNNPVLNVTGRQTIEVEQEDCPTPLMARFLRPDEEFPADFGTTIFNNNKMDQDLIAVSDCGSHDNVTLRTQEEDSDPYAMINYNQGPMYSKVPSYLPEPIYYEEPDDIQPILSEVVDLPSPQIQVTEDDTLVDIYSDPGEINNQGISAIFEDLQFLSDYQNIGENAPNDPIAALEDLLYSNPGDPDDLLDDPFLTNPSIDQKEGTFDQVNKGVLFDNNSKPSFNEINLLPDFTSGQGNSDNAQAYQVDNSNNNEQQTPQVVNNDDSDQFYEANENESDPTVRPNNDENNQVPPQENTSQVSDYRSAHKESVNQGAPPVSSGSSSSSSSYGSSFDSSQRTFLTTKPNTNGNSPNIGFSDFSDLKFSEQDLETFIQLYEDPSTATDASIFEMRSKFNRLEDQVKRIISNEKIELLNNIHFFCSNATATPEVIEWLKRMQNAYKMFIQHFKDFQIFALQYETFFLVYQNLHLLSAFYLKTSTVIERLEAINSLTLDRILKVKVITGELVKMAFTMEVVFGSYKSNTFIFSSSGSRSRKLEQDIEKVIQDCYGLVNDFKRAYQHNWCIPFTPLPHMLSFPPNLELDPNDGSDMYRTRLENNYRADAV